MPEQCELLFKVQIIWSDPEDFASCVEFFIRAKAIIVSSKLRGETIAITSKLKQFVCFGKEESSRNSLQIVTRCEIFEHKNEEYIALGCRDGSVVVKLSGTILSQTNVAHIKPTEDQNEEEEKSNTQINSMDTT